jgi:hypothetical protein
MADEAIQQVPGMIDPLLLRRLIRPIAQPGLIRIRQAYQIVERIEAMLPANALAERLARRTQPGEADGADLPLVVVGRPSLGMPAEQAPHMPASAVPAGHPPALPVTKPIPQPNSLPAGPRPVEPAPAARRHGEHSSVGVPSTETLHSPARQELGHDRHAPSPLVSGQPQGAPAGSVPAQPGRAGPAAPGLVQRSALATSTRRPPLAMPEARARAVAHMPVAAIRPGQAAIGGTERGAIMPNAVTSISAGHMDGAAARMADAITSAVPAHVPPHSSAALPIVRALQAPTRTASQTTYQAPAALQFPVMPAPVQPFSGPGYAPVVPAVRPAEPAFQIQALQAALPLAIPAQFAAEKTPLQAARQEPGAPIGTTRVVPTIAPSAHAAVPPPPAQPPAPDQRAIVRQVERRFRHALRIEAERRGEPR